MFTKLLYGVVYGAAALEVVALVGAGVVAMAPACEGTRRAFLRRAEAAIESRTAKSGSVEASLDAIALRDIKRLRRTAKQGWHPFYDFESAERIVRRSAAPLATEGYKVLKDMANNLVAEVRKGLDSTWDWPATRAQAA